jgi:hypothetical protein
MSERERWVVYPLLFLALGAALRDKLIDRTITKSIVCQELMVLDEAGVLAQIGRNDSMRAASNAFMVVNGQLDTNLINAKQYAFRDMPFVPVLQTIMSAPIDMLRTLQQSKGEPSPGMSSNPLPSQTEADTQTRKDASNTAQSQSQSVKNSDDSDETPREAPLADPAENR